MCIRDRFHTVYNSFFKFSKDEDNCVVVYILDEKDKNAPWKYLGKHRAHYKPISGQYLAISTNHIFHFVSLLKLSFLNQSMIVI